MNYSVAVSEKLLQIKAIKLSPQSPFTWASGIKSPIYCDNRITLSYPEVRNIIKGGFTHLAGNFPEANVIAGVATAGIAHGALLADALNLPYLYVRSAPKSHGRQNQIEGELPAGAKVLVVEDLISTGGSSIAAAEVLAEAGADILSILAIFNYNLNIAIENFRKAQMSFQTISDFTTLLDQAEKGNFISHDEALLLSSWNESPEKWSNKYLKSVENHH